MDLLSDPSSEIPPRFAAIFIFIMFSIAVVFIFSSIWVMRIPYRHAIRLSMVFFAAFSLCCFKISSAFPIHNVKECTPNPTRLCIDIANKHFFGVLGVPFFTI